MDVDAQEVIDAFAASMGRRMGETVAALEKENVMLRLQFQAALRKIAELNGDGEQRA